MGPFVVDVDGRFWDAADASAKRLSPAFTGCGTDRGRLLLGEQILVLLARLRTFLSLRRRNTGNASYAREQERIAL